MSDQNHDGEGRPGKRLPTRRQWLSATAAAATASLAGCSAVTDLLAGASPDVAVFNKTDDTRTVTVDVTYLPDDEQVVSKTVDVEPDDGKPFEDVFDRSGRYEFAVETDDGRSDTHEWDLSSTDHALHVRIESGGIRFDRQTP